MTRQISFATSNEKLELAIELNKQFDELCRERGFEPELETDIMALAISARAGAAHRHCCAGQIKMVIEN